MAQTMCHVLDTIHQEHLIKNQLSTGFPPHFFITFDKSTFNGVTNQAIVICPVINGTRRSLLIDSAAVYSTNAGENGVEVVGGSDRDLAKQIREKFGEHLPSVSFHQAMGAAADGQYRSATFREALFCDETQYRRVTWDQGHLLDLIFKSTTKGVGECFISRVQKRLSLYNRKLKHGLGYVAVMAAAEELQQHCRVIKSFSVIRFFSSFLAALKNLIEHFSMYQKALYDHCGVRRDRENTDCYNEDEYLLFGKDLFFDICLIVDVLTVLKEASISSQSLTLPFFNVIRSWQRCERQLTNMFQDLRAKKFSANLFPVSHKYRVEIQASQFNGGTLVDGWLVKSKTQQHVEWIERTESDCLKEGKDFLQTIRREMKERKALAINSQTQLLFGCFDPTEWFLKAIGNDSAISLANIIKYFNQCAKVPHLQEFMAHHTAVDAYQNAMGTFKWLVSSSSSDATSFREVIFGKGVGGDPIESILDDGTLTIQTRRKTTNTELNFQAFVELLYTKKELYARFGKCFCLR